MPANHVITKARYIHTALGFVSLATNSDVTTGIGSLGEEVVWLQKNCINVLGHNLKMPIELNGLWV